MNNLIFNTSFIHTMQITGTHFNYFILCKRKLWLFANSISMEHTSDLVYEGKLIHETAYPQRSERYEELELDGIKIDYYDSSSKVIHEIKKSDKVSQAHEWQIKYYIYVLEQNGISGVKGILEYPALRKREWVEFTDADRKEIEQIKQDIASIIHSETAPVMTDKKICRNCSYYDFCFSGEEEL